MVISAKNILSKTCEVWGVSESDLLSRNRTMPLPLVRSVVAWSIKKSLNLSLSKIGELLNRTHGTVSHLLVIYESEYLYNKEFRTFANEMRNFTLDMVNEFQEELQEELCEIIG